MHELDLVKGRWEGVVRGEFGLDGSGPPAEFIGVDLLFAKHGVECLRVGKRRGPPELVQPTEETHDAPQLLLCGSGVGPIGQDVVNPHRHSARVRGEEPSDARIRRSEELWT